MSFMYPWSLPMPGHLHILYNALEETVCKCEDTNSFLEDLRICENFCSNRDLRTLFSVACLPSSAKEEQTLAKHHPVIHVDWRWEFLSNALADLIPRIVMFQKYSSLEKIANCSPSMAKNSLLLSFAAVLDKPNLSPLCHLFFVFGKLLERYAHILESCWCHGHIWTSQTSGKRKAKLLIAESGHDRCFWKGRMAAWWVACGLDELLNAIHTCTSDQLQAQLDSAGDSKASLLDLNLCLRNRLFEVLVDKFGFWRHVPWKLIGVYYCCCGGTAAAAQALLHECVLEYDTAVADGLGHQLHRLAHIFLRPCSRCRREVDAFIEHGGALLDYPCLYAWLLQYALVGLVERCVEGLHARLKRLGKQSTYILPPYACALTRSEQTMALLRANSDFHAMCCRVWPRKTFLTGLLRLRGVVTSPLVGQYQKSSFLLKRVYQMTQEDQFRDIAAAQVARANWLVATTAARLVPQRLSDGAKSVVSYLKAAFQKGYYYSMSRELFENASSTTCKFEVTPALLQAFCALSKGSTVEFPVEHVNDHVFFQVINPRPEARHLLHAPHVQPVTTAINVFACALVSSKRQLSQVIVFNDFRSHQSLDMRALLADIGKSLACIYRWSTSKKAVFVKDKPVVMPALSVETQIGGARPRRSPANLDIVAGTVSTEVLQLAAQPMRLAPYMLGLWSMYKQAPPGGGDPQFTTAVQRGSVDASDGEIESALAKGVIISVGGGLLQLHRGAIQLSRLFLLAHPVQIYRGFFGADHFKSCKLDLIMQLLCGRWVPFAGEHLVNFTEESPKYFRCTVQRPLGYFVALLRIGTIFLKGISEVSHYMADAYYRCLVLLPNARLLALKNMETNFARDDCAAALADGGHELDTGGEESAPQLADAITLPALPVVYGEHALLPACQTIVPEHLWVRRLITNGSGTLCVKVYFDNCSHPSGVQRGWTDCHCDSNCIRYRRCTGSVEHFVAETYAWQLAAHDHHNVPYLCPHLECVPDEATVSSIRQSMDVRYF